MHQPPLRLANQILDEILSGRRDLLYTIAADDAIALAVIDTSTLLSTTDLRARGRQIDTYLDTRNL